jgi:hypothetical protein
MAEKWIKSAIKRPGALRKKLGVKEGEKIPTDKIDSMTAKLKKQAEGDKKLSTSKRRLLRQLVLAKTLRGMD